MHAFLAESAVQLSIAADGPEPFHFSTSDSANHPERTQFAITSLRIIAVGATVPRPLEAAKQQMKLLQCPSVGAIYVCVSDVVVNMNTKQRYLRDVSDVTASQAGDNGSVTIVSICVSHDQNCLLVAYSNKDIYCFDSSNSNVIGKIVLKKKPTALVQISLEGYGDCKSSGLVLVSDKEGSVLAISYPTLSKQVVVAGHTASIITDMDIVTSSISSSKDSLNLTNIGLVATSDRDEKIRISQVPHLETIERYCLGHENVVTSVSFLKGKTNASQAKVLLVSCGWDGKILLWDACTGAILDSIIAETNTGPSSSSSTKNDNEEAKDSNVGDDDAVEEKVYDSKDAGNYPLKLCASRNSDTVAAIYFGLSKVDVFSVLSHEDGSVKFGAMKTINLPSPPVDASFLADSDDLVILLPKPHLIAYLTVNIDMCSREVECVAEDTSPSALDRINNFKQIVSTIDTFTDFKQQLILSGNEGTSAEAGIKKHAMISLHEKHMQDFAESVKKKKQKK